VEWIDPATIAGTADEPITGEDLTVDSSGRIAGNRETHRPGAPELHNIDTEALLMSRQNISSGRPWEAQAGYSRAVRMGGLFETSLTSPSAPDGSILHSGDVYRQTALSLELIGNALEEAGLEYADVICTRIYMLDTSRWADAGRAHAEVFSEIRPALSFIGVSGFFDPLIDVEVTVTAYRPL